MNTLTVNPKLLALLLTLTEFNSPLSKLEQTALREAAEQLHLEPQNWESDLPPELLSVLQSNPRLNQLYQTADFQLDSLGDFIPTELLPTLAELEQVIPATEPIQRGFPPITDETELDNREINNVAINILSTSNPPATAKKLSSLGKLQQFLSQHKVEPSKS